VIVSNSSAHNIILHKQHKQENVQLSIYAEGRTFLPDLVALNPALTDRVTLQRKPHSLVQTTHHTTPTRT